MECNSLVKVRESEQGVSVGWWGTRYVSSAQKRQVQEALAQVNIKALGCVQLKTLLINPTVSMLTNLYSCRRICALSWCKQHQQKGQTVVSITLHSFIGTKLNASRDWTFVPQGAFLRYVLSICEIQFSKGKICISEAFLPSDGNLTFLQLSSELWMHQVEGTQLDAWAVPLAAEII